MVWFFAFHVGVVRHADQSILQGFYGLGQRGRVRSVANWIANLCDPKPYVYLVWIPVAVALLRRRPGLAIAVAVILLGANVTTEVLKSITAVPRPLLIQGSFPPVGAKSWPSGHATAAMSLALCCVLVAPGRVAAGGGGAGRRVHGGGRVLVPGARLALPERRARRVPGGDDLDAGRRQRAAGRAGAPRGPRRADGAAVGHLGARPTGGGGAGRDLSRGRGGAGASPRVVSYARAHEAFIVGAVAIGAVALALAAGLMLAVRR